MGLITDNGRDITCISDLISNVGESRRGLYRGETEVGRPILPKLGRVKNEEARKDIRGFSSVAIQLQREASISEFASLGHALLSEEVRANPWKLTAVAQHHGLPTCFLDWSWNSLVALYFACERKPELDGCVYFISPDDQMLGPTLEEISRPVTNLERVIVYEPEHITARVTQQSGAFTVHPFPAKDLSEEESITRWVVKAEAKGRLLEQLDVLNIHKWSLFPDLDGLAAYLGSRRRSEVEQLYHKRSERSDRR